MGSAAPLRAGSRWEVGRTGFERPPTARSWPRLNGARAQRLAEHRVSRPWPSVRVCRRVPAPAYRACRRCLKGAAAPRSPTTVTATRALPWHGPAPSSPHRVPPASPPGGGSAALTGFLSRAGGPVSRQVQEMKAGVPGSSTRAEATRSSAKGCWDSRPSGARHPL